MRILDLARESFKLEDEAIMKIVANSSIIDKIFSYFQNYKFNNMLHLKLFGILKDILEGTDLDMKLEMIAKSNFTKNIIKISEDVSEYEMTQTRTVRCGYMAFMTELTAILEKQKLTHDHF